MPDHTPEDVEKIVDKAKKEDRQAKRANEVINESISSLDTKRNNNN
jgi:hypothetical protein